MYKEGITIFEQDFLEQSYSDEGQLIKKQDQISTLPSSKERRLEKNRISAHNSRLKKKKYLQDLQNNQKRLLQELQKTEQELQKTKEQLNTILTKNKQNDSFNHDEKPTYERLNQLLRSQSTFDEDEANMLIELLIDRVGVTGKQRQRMVDYYTKRLINFSIPAIYRYLLKNSTEQKGLLSETDQIKQKLWDRQLLQTLKMTQQQKKQFKQMNEKMKQEKFIWISLAKRFTSTRSEIYSVAQQIQEWLLTIKQLLSVRQTGQIIIGIQKRKYNRDISLTQDTIKTQPYKKMKLQ